MKSYTADISTLDIPYIKKYGTDLTEKVDIDSHNAVGREDKLAEIKKILTHLVKNDPIITGPAGSGKTALVEALAVNLKKNNVPDMLKGYHIFEINAGTLDSDGAGHLGYFNDNLSHIIKEGEKYNKQIILFIDEFHIMIGASNNGGRSGMDGSQLLKPAMARGAIRLIGATTNTEWRKFVEPDKALVRRFYPVNIAQTDIEVTQGILKKLIPKYQKHYGPIQANNDVINLMVTLADRYIPTRSFPDKAIDMLDDSMALAYQKEETEISRKDVADSIYQRTGIPADMIATSLNPNIVNLRKDLQKRVKGQDAQIDEVVKAIDLSFAGLNDSHKPLASFLFIGTSGVGKTELAKAIAESIFGDENNMIRLDMGGYNTPTAVQDLIGTDDKPGALTDSVRSHPYSVLLLDEIEKASPKVMDLLLSILDDGEIRDGVGNMINFKNLIIILTSNLAAKTILNENEWLGDQKVSVGEAKMRKQVFRERVNMELKRHFRPEMVNRFGHKIIFNVLNTSQMIKISKKYMDRFQADLLKKSNIYLIYDRKAMQYLVRIGTTPKDGARPMKNIINDVLMGKLAEQLVAAKSDPNNLFNNVRKVLLTTTGNPPTATDLYGTERFAFTALSGLPTEEEKAEMKKVFTEDGIAKMIAARKATQSTQEALNKKYDKKFKKSN